MPKVSVITTTYNRSHTIGRAIESVRGQTVADWEHIIVDDGSCVDTSSVVAQYAEMDSRIICVQKENGGFASGANAGAGLARSTMLAFLDSDDEFTPHHLRKRLEYLAAHPEVAMVWGGLRPVGPRKRHFVGDTANFGCRAHATKCRVTGTFVLHQSIFERVAGFRKVMASDYDFCRRVEAMGAQVHRVNFPTLIYHVAGDDRMSVRSDPVDKHGELLVEPDWTTFPR